MINVKKSQPAPACLAIEKAKPNSKKYDCEGVKQQLVDDFFNKCYVCEEKDKDAIVEHFQSHHQGKFRDLMFDWNNLFLCCDNCNRIKGDRFDAILNCTDFSQKVTEWIEYEVIQIPIAKVKITVKEDGIPTEFVEVAKNTAEFLQKIYNGTNYNNKFNAKNTIKKINHQILDLEILIEEYSSGNQNTKADIIKHLQPDTPFTAFKHWIIKRNKKLSIDFQAYLN